MPCNGFDILSLASGNVVVACYASYLLLTLFSWRMVWYYHVILSMYTMLAAERER